MAEVGLHRTDGRGRPGISEERLHRVKLHLVAKRGSGRVAFDVVHRLRINPGTRIGPFKGKLLPLGVWTEDELPAPVVGKPDSGNHCVDAVAVAFSVAESLQHEHSCTLAGKQASGGAIERTTFSNFRIRLKD